jgi:diadenosine tetraphosphate (Ap4A) HIT family hydrolase
MDELGPSSAIWLSDGWRVAHSFNSALLGWLVVVPRRHIESIHELSDDESVELGRLLRRASQALVDVVGCQKTYVMMFAEAAGFNHVHFHVVPRAHDLDAEHRGSSIFEYLKRPETEWIGVAEQDELALALRSADVEWLSFAQARGGSWSGATNPATTTSTTSRAKRSVSGRWVWSSR